MMIHGLATDYDDTIASDGLVDVSTRETLSQWKQTGRKLVLVTGRELPDVLALFHGADLFDRIVAENGALVFNPNSGETRLLAKSPPENLVQMLRQKKVFPLATGHVILATREPNEKKVLEAIHVLGLEYQVTFNKGAVMVLPSGVNKATGLKSALKELGLQPENIAGIGDAENDHSFLELAGVAGAVANALPALKEKADYVCQGERGRGVAEFIKHLLAQDPPGNKHLPETLHGPQPLAQGSRAN